MKLLAQSLLISFSLCVTAFYCVGSLGTDKSKPISSGVTETKGPFISGMISRHAVSSQQLHVPAKVKRIFKLKCYLCHSSRKSEGGFDLEAMRHRKDPASEWRSIDWPAATQIKLAILPIDGKPARMPKKFQSTWHPLTREEANSVAAWTDYPFEK